MNSPDLAFPLHPAEKIDVDAMPARRSYPHRVDSADLIGPARELIIVHNGREYRLRLTQNGKMILTA